VFQIIQKESSTMSHQT